MKVQDIPLTDIHADDTFNCRGVIAPIDVIDLAKDIKERGLIQPVTLAPYDEEKQKETGYKYRLLAGFRRFTAFKVNQSARIPSIVRPDMMDEINARYFNLSENIQRKDLNVLQEAQALKVLKDLGVSEVEAADKLGKTRGWIQIRYLLLKLPDPIQKEVAAGFINQTQVRELYTVKLREGEDKCFEAAKQIKEAKQRGRTISVKPKGPQNSKRHRKRGEIFQMMEHIQDSGIGNGLWTRALAWAAGEISDQDFDATLRVYAADNGITYVGQING